MARKTKSAGRKLFRDPCEQTTIFDRSPEEQLETERRSKVECLGMTFDNEEARRNHFLAQLLRKLQDPEFRRTPGFPGGSDEAILRMSDPPWYTACPNPFLEDFVRHYGRPYHPNEPYHREPLAVDVSEGKNDAFYKVHGYHTKVPYLAIVPSLLHYTSPGDIVLDGFCGSGMTGVAAQFCGAAPRSYRKQVEAKWATLAKGQPSWGMRRVILADLSPVATFIAANYNIPFDTKEFRDRTSSLLAGAYELFGELYETKIPNSEERAPIELAAWSEIFACPNCSAQLSFLEQTFDPSRNKVDAKLLACPHCKKPLKTRELVRLYETVNDPGLPGAWKRATFRPFQIQLKTDKQRHRKAPDRADVNLIERTCEESLSPVVPITPFPFDQMWEAPRLRTRGVTHTHHLYFPRMARVMAALWGASGGESDQRMALAVRFWLGSQLTNLSILNRYRPDVSFPYNPLPGAYYVSSALCEANPFRALENKAKRIAKVFGESPARTGSSITSVGHAGALGIPNESVDYIFTDPPFGDNFAYSELNFHVEAWHGVIGAADAEAIVDRSKKDSRAQKSIIDYQRLMVECFSEYFRVLKPGRWMTVVFSNSKNAVWRAIQESVGVSGFVVADVRTLDKQLGSFKQVTSSAVKQDLVISAYKPVTGPKSNGEIVKVGEESAWSFVREHLDHVPIFVSQGGQAEIVAERTPQVLLDRMIAFHVQRGLSVPIDSSDFFKGLGQKFPKREGMYFLPNQIPEFDRKRMTVTELRQLTLFPTDEASAIQWLRQQLERKPQRQQDITPLFHKEIHGWAKHEKTIDIRQLLEQSFLRYDGTGPVPLQIVSYLKQSSSHRPRIQSIEERLGKIPDSGLETKDQTLLSAATDLWYVPDPGRQGDLERARDKQLLKEFEEYKLSKARRIKEFRTEAVRAGFVAAFRSSPNDYEAIVTVAKKLPESVLVDNQDLYTYYDVARMRLGRE